jgi:hypothetical protein
VSVLAMADRVRETSTTSGTGTLSLAGAVTGFQSFSAGVGNGNSCYYCCADQSGSAWEVGIGTYLSSGSTLSRTTVLASSNSGSLVSFSSTTHDVFVTLPGSIASLIGTATGVDASLFTGTANATVANTSSETTLLGSGTGSLIIPSVVLGKCVRFRARGFWSSLALTAGNITLNFKAGSTVLATTGAMTVPLSQSNAYWEVEADINIYSITAGGVVWTQGRFLTQIAALAAQIAGMVNTGSAGTSSLSSALGLTATWSVASASNTITCTNVSVDSVN